MNDITLEKLDIIRERTGVTYGEAKDALNVCDGDVVEALIFLEESKKKDPSQVYTTLEGFKAWLEAIIEKGNVKRIRIRKDDKIMVDVPLNAGVAASVIALVWTPLMIFTVATAVITKITVEITNEDGSVEVINKVIKSSVSEACVKTTSMASKLVNKVKKTSNNFKNKVKGDDVIINDEPIYKYTVNFDESVEK